MNMENKEGFIVWASVVISVILSDIVGIEPVILIILDVAIVSAALALVKKFRREKKPVKETPAGKSVGRCNWGSRHSRIIKILVIAIIFILYGACCMYAVSMGELTVSTVVSITLIVGAGGLILILVVVITEKKIMERGDKRDWIVARSETVRTLVKTRKEEEWEKNTPSNRQFIFLAIGFILFVCSDIYWYRKGIKTSPLYLLVFFGIEFVMSKLEELTRKKK